MCLYVCLRGLGGGIPKQGRWDMRLSKALGVSVAFRDDQSGGGGSPWPHAVGLGQVCVFKARLFPVCPSISSSDKCLFPPDPSPLSVELRFWKTSFTYPFFEHLLEDLPSARHWPGSEDGESTQLLPSQGVDRRA